MNDRILNPTDGSSSKNTILTYNLSEPQLKFLQDAVKVKEIKGRNLKIFRTNDFIDIMVIPHFMAFLNFAGVPALDIRTFFDYWGECCSKFDIPAGSDDELKKLAGELQKIRMPVTYILNCAGSKIKKAPNLYLNSNIFDVHDKLRLAVLHEIKQIEKAESKDNEFDWGWRSDKGTPMKLRRLLLIYRHLLSKGWINKETVDRLCKSRGLDPVSDRSFFRDLEAIRSIGEVVGFNKEQNRYELGLETYTHTGYM